VPRPAPVRRTAPAAFNRPSVSQARAGVTPACSATAVAVYAPARSAATIPSPPLGADAPCSGTGTPPSAASTR
jgi:hypothetical protein